MIFLAKPFSRFVAAFLTILLVGQTANAAKPFIIDTDLGVDDAIALLYLLKRPDLDIKAITIAGTGSAHCGPAVRNTLGLLKLVNRSDIPVACGRSTPLRGQHHFPPAVLAQSDTLAGTANRLPQVLLPPSQKNAVALLIKTLQNAQEPVTILAIGPLTNLAEMLQKAPPIKSHIQAIYIMGAAIHVPGNLREVDASLTNKKAEWNIYLDPLAASIVLNENLPLVVVPLDVTNRLPLDLKFYEALKQQHRTPAANYVYLLLKNNMQMLKAKEWYFWDPLAAVIASDESVATYYLQHLNVLLTPENQAGRTIINDSSSGQRLRITEKVDETRFKQILMTVLNSV